MRPVRVIDLECEFYPLNQIHVPADIIDIVEELGAVRAAPRAIAVRKDPARCTVGVCAVVHHSEQELGDGCNPAAPRSDPEVEFFLQTPAGVRAEDRRVLGELSGLIERLGEIGRADEPVRIAPERQAVSALEVIHTRFDLDEDEFTPLDG